MYDRYAVIRHGKEVKRIVGVDHYTMDVTPPRITFFAPNGSVIDRIPAQVGDVVRPVVIGFHSGLPPIDQSEARIRELTERMARLQEVHEKLGLPLEQMKIINNEECRGVRRPL